MDIRIANWMLRYVAKVCNKYKGLGVEVYRNLNDDVYLELGWADWLEEE